MKKFLMVSWSLLFVSCGSDHLATYSTFKVADEKSIRERLNQLAQDLADLKKTVRRVDEPRIYVMMVDVGHAQEMLKTKGVVNTLTLRSLMRLVGKFVHADLFFQFIRKDFNAELIDRILSMTIDLERDSLRKDIGYDENRPSELADNFNLILLSLRNLIQSNDIPDDVRMRLRPLVGTIGTTMALAQAQGDRPVAMCEGIKRCHEIDAIYPVLDQLTGTSQFFKSTQEIRGRNEALKEFLQVQLKPKKEDGVPSLCQ